MDFRYVAYTEDRRILTGTQSAASADIAARVLASRGYKVLNLKAIPAFLPRWEQIFPSFNKVSTDTLVLFSRQLALLLESGTDLVTSLELLRVQATRRRFKTVLGEVIADLRRGERLSRALAKHPHVFSKMFVQSLLVGEQVGAIESMLRQIADYLEKESTAAKNIKNALRYPIIVSIVAAGVIAVLTLFVLPAFNSLYQQLGVELPRLTRMTFATVGWLSQYGIFLLIALGAIVFGIYLYGRTPQGRLHLDRIILRLPVIGRVVHLNELIRCCRSISILHKSGLPVSEIMGLVIEASGNLVIKQALTAVHQDVLKGQGLSRPMTRSRYFLPMMVQMVGVGEATGNLDATLTATADSYETEATQRMRAMIDMIQPIITVALAVVVGIIASALVFAMYSIYGNVSV